MDFLQVLVDQMHVALIQNYVDQAKQFDLLVSLDQLSVLLIDIFLELSVEVRLNYGLMIRFIGRGWHNNSDDFSLGSFIVFKLSLVGIVHPTQE